MRNKLGVVIVLFLVILLVFLTKGLIGSVKSFYNHTKEINTKIDSYKLEIKDIDGLSYYLYSPNKKENKFGLIIYLHGNSNDIEKDNFVKLLSEGYYKDINSYVVIPKLESNDWINEYNKIINIINYMYNTYDIDINKITLTGYDNGGTGVYELQSKLPNTFACILPINGDITNSNVDINKIGKTKVWAYTNTEDSYTVSTINNIKITKYSGDISNEYKNKEVINWLVNCSK